MCEPLSHCSIMDAIKFIFSSKRLPSRNERAPLYRWWARLARARNFSREIHQLFINSLVGCVYICVLRNALKSLIAWVVVSYWFSQLLGGRMRQGGPHKKNKLPLASRTVRAANAIKRLVVRWPTLKLEHITHTHIFCCARGSILCILVTEVSCER